MSSAIANPAPTHPEKSKHKSKDKSKIKDKEKGKGKAKPITISSSSTQKMARALPPHDDLPSSSEGELEYPDTATTATSAAATMAAPGHSFVPPGSVLLSKVVDGDDFDYDKLKDDEDLELWVVRVPDGVKPKHLTHLSLTVPPSHATTSQKIGSLSRKHTSYDVWSIRPPSDASTSTTNLNLDMEEDVDGAITNGDAVGGEELLSMNVLLPRRKKGGRLFVAPKPITQHLVLTAQSAQPSLPTPPASPAPNSFSTSYANTAEDMYKSPARYQHPRHLLKHRFMPTGAGLRVPPPSVLSTQTNQSGGSVSALGEDGKKHEDVDMSVVEATEETATGDSKKVKKAKVKDKGKEKHKKEKEKKVIDKGEEEKKEDGQAQVGVEETAPKKKRKAEGEGKKAKKPKIDVD